MSAMGACVITCIFYSHFISGGPLRWSLDPMAVVAAPAAPVQLDDIERPFILGGWRSTRWALSYRTARSVDRVGIEYDLIRFIFSKQETNTYGDW